MPSREDLIDEIKRLSEPRNRPTKLKMRMDGEYSIEQYEEKFGNWSSALEESGKPWQRSEEEIISEIRRVCEELERAPHFKEVQEKSNIGRGEISKLFGNWTNAVKESGYPPQYWSGPSRQDLIDEFVRVYEEKGDIPKVTEFQERGDISYTKYYEEFGSWRKTVEAAGLEYSIDYHSGEKHGRWKGGAVNNYGSNWLYVREERLSLDDFECQNCGMTNEESEKKYGRGLEVHHIVPIKEFEEPEDGNYIENLISLCTDCHRKVESGIIDIS